MVVLAASLAGCSAAPKTIPRELQGRWDLQAASCTDPEGVSAMRVEPTRVSFYEAGGSVSAVRRVGPRIIDLTMQRWSSTDDPDPDSHALPPEHPVARLTLSPDRNAVTFAIEGQGMTYVRCPAAKGSGEEISS